MKRKLVISWLVALLLAGGLEGRAIAQGVSRQSVEQLLASFEQGDYSRLDDLLERKEEAVTTLRVRARHRQANVRVTALDLLGRIDLKDDGILNRDDVIDTMINTIDGSETNVDVLDEALRQLDRIDPKKASPRIVRALLLQLERGRARAIRVLGRLGDPTVRSVLERYVSQKRGVGELAQQALAKLGDERYLNEIIAELNVEGPVRSKAIEKLAYIASKSTVREIAKFLYDPRMPPSEIGPRDRVGYLPYQHTAAWALGQIVENPPVQKDLGLLTEQDIEAWKAWWEAHQGEYP